MFVKLFVFSISSCGKVSEEQKATTSTPFKKGPAVFELQYLEYLLFPMNQRGKIKLRLLINFNCIVNVLIEQKNDQTETNSIEQSFHEMEKFNVA